jgi:very-short-patch-repair endonuclease/restriction endonuclease S subunit
VQPNQCSGQPYIGLEHIGQGTLRLEGIGTGDDINSLKSKFEAGDVLFGKLRPYFRKVVRPDFAGVCSTDIWVVRAKPGCDQGFIFYWMASPEFVALANSASEGTKMPRAKWDYVAKHQKSVPPLPEQRAIAHILGTLDDKIECNRRLNRTLEGIVRALFQSWFIDFDPVRRNAARDQNQPSPPAPLPGGEGMRGNYRGGYDFAGLVETARELRKKQTSVEVMFWEWVRDRRFMGLKFRRQHQLGDYVVDFYCHERRLVIELDGVIHASKRAKDHKRDAWMQAQAFNVLRFPNEQLLDDPESILITIADTVCGLESPLPWGEGWGEGSVEAFDRLFPDTFEDSDLGPIPKGWKVGSLGDVADSPRRGVNPSDVPPTTPYIGLEHMPRRCIALDAWGRAEDVASGKSQFKQGEILFGKLRPYFHKVGVAPMDGVCSTDIVVVTPKASHWHGYVISLVSSKAFVDYTDSHSAGTKMPRTNWKDMSRYPLALPPVTLAKAFQEHVASFHQRIILNVRQNRRLAGLRDTLLPKLLSGEIELPAAEAVAEEVT